jgi:SAM-dependent methyltransferase
MTGWDDPEVAAYYEAFCTSHSRYQRANAVLVARAGIKPGMRLLDLAAGTGRTTEPALRRLGVGGAVLCVESSACMRAQGMRRVRDPRVAWRAELPDERGSFDRILCGAAIWQMAPLEPLFKTLAELLKTRGALCFNIPALYLMEGEESGGGSDPLLLELPGLLMESCGESSCDGHERLDARAPLTRDRIDAELAATGLHAVEWSFHTRMSQHAYASWLKIPATTNRLLATLSPAERARQIDLASSFVDRGSWKRERWRGWTAWKR